MASATASFPAPVELEDLGGCPPLVQYTASQTLKSTADQDDETSELSVMLRPSPHPSSPEFEDNGGTLPSLQSIVEGAEHQEHDQDGQAGTPEQEDYMRRNIEPSMDDLLQRSTRDRQRDGKGQDLDAGELASESQKYFKDFEYDPIESSLAESKGYPKLDYKPVQLKTWFLALALAFFTACMASVTTLTIWSHKSSGVLIVGSRGHLGFRYVPPILGTITTLWWRTIIQNLGRFTPYISMAADRGITLQHDKYGRSTQRKLHTDYADADPFALISVASNGHWLLFGGILTQVFINLFLVGGKSVFVQSAPVEGGWRIVVSQKIGYTLISIYALLILCNLATLIRLYGRETGLKWDPVSIADQLALVQGSNVWPLFYGLEFLHRRRFLKALKESTANAGSLRLGYWKHQRDNSIWHGLALLPKSRDPRKDRSQTTISVHNNSHAEFSRLPGSERDRDRNHESNRQAPSLSPSSGAPKRLRGYQYPFEVMQKHALHRDPQITQLATLRYRSFNFFLSDTVLMIFAAAALGALAAAITGLANDHLKDGFKYVSLVPCFKPPCQPYYHLPAGLGSTSASTFDAISAFLFRFLPVELMGFFGVLWLNADNFYRSTEPFAGMNNAAPATSSLLLDYPSSMPFVVTLKAASNGHWRVALLSLYSLLGTIPPVIATGMFVSTRTTEGLHIAIQPANFWFCFSILSVYLISLPLVRPVTAYRLPRSISNIADLLSYCYASRVVDEKILDTSIFSVQDSTDTRAHLKSKIHLAKQKYQFGFYMGKDGNRHLGFDIAERQNTRGAIETVDKVDPGKTVYLSSDGWRWFFRYPHIMLKDV